ncbi:hypothetical protein C8Q77DRAFT_1158915 [Trametes polyzona]|nr:hypothetical protein C8Q77DRAFT_1158915 [Trametes polyzona]
MFLPMQGRYPEQDYYPPLSSSRSSRSGSRSRSPSPRPRPLTRTPSSRSRSASNAQSQYAPRQPQPPHARAPPSEYTFRAPTSIPLDDNFDAPTTAAPTEWGRFSPSPPPPQTQTHSRPARSAQPGHRAGPVEVPGPGPGHRAGDGHPEYDESVTGYENYVVEMELMLEGQMEGAARAQERIREAVRERERELQLERQRQQEHDRMWERLDPPPPPPPHPPPHSHSRARHRRKSVTSASASVNMHMNVNTNAANMAAVGRRTGTSPVALRRIDTTAGTGTGSTSGRRSLAPMSPPPAKARQQPEPAPPPENTRQVSGKKGRLELVEQRVLEDTATRTISLWRERVAASSVGGGGGGESTVDAPAPGSRTELREGGADGDGRSEVGSHIHRRVPSASINGDQRMRRVVSDHARYAGSVQGSKNGSGKQPRGTYERSEYIVSYGNKGVLQEVVSPSADEKTGVVPGRDLRTPSSPTTNTNKSYYDRPPPSPTLRRHAARKSLDRSEYLVSYPNTPPLTGSQTSSGSPTRKGHLRNGHSPLLASPPTISAGLRLPLHGSFRDMRDTLPPTPETDGSVLKAGSTTTTTSVEAILASCDPSLLHIAPVLQELGIKRVDHLRAVARLSEDTRNREVKEQALRRGVSVVEWAIFLDKLQTL